MAQAQAAAAEPIHGSELLRSPSFRGPRHRVEQGGAWEQKLRFLKEPEPAGAFHFETQAGGVGAQQMQAQVEAFRQQLLAQQYDYGLKLSGIGDNIAMGAIKTGLQADQYVQQLTNNYYSNIARVAFGSAPQVAGTPATTPAG